MIAKAGRAGGAGSGFAKLGAYVLGEKGGKRAAKAGRGEPVGMAALTDYMLDQERHSGKVGWSRVTNCAALDPRRAIREIIATQAKNTRARGDKSYHLIIAFPPGERPAREQIEDIEDRLVAAIGLGDHQRISALHRDKDHLHLHVAINRVHPETLRCGRASHDYARLAEAAAELEVKHGLFRSNHGLRAERGRKPGRAWDMEAHQRRESFAAWVARTARPALTDAAAVGDGWQELHQAAARFGLTIQPRGAGVVIRHRDEAALMMKASAVDRALGYGALTAKWGSYQPPAEIGQAPPAAVYERPSLDRSPAGPDLWKTYQAGREAMRAQRAAALDELRGKNAAYLDEVRAHYDTQFRLLKTGRLHMGIDARIRTKALKEERAKLMAGFKARAAEQRQAIRDSHQVKQWSDWLRARAEVGDLDALGALRSMDNRQHNFTESLIRVPEEAVGKVLVATSRQPNVGKNGEITYRVADGGVVVDEAREIRVPDTTRASAVLALSLAKERFGEAPLTVTGDPAFRRALIEASMLPGAGVSFADPGMQAERERLLAERAPTNAPEGAVERFIRAQNRWPDPKAPLTYRLREPGDQGEAVFLGVKAVDERQSVFLWRQGEAVMVEPVTAENRAAIRNLRAGANVTLFRLAGTTAQEHTREGGSTPEREEGIDL